MRGSLDDYMADTGAALTVYNRDAGDLMFSTVSQADVDAVRAVPGVEDVARSHFFVVRPPRTDGEPPALPVPGLSG